MSDDNKMKMIWHARGVVIRHTESTNYLERKQN